MQNGSIQLQSKIYSEGWNQSIGFSEKNAR